MECDNPYICMGTTCQLRPPGYACMAGSDCLSGFCTEGVCCDQSDCGTCGTCKLTGLMGFCQPVAAGGVDPKGVCAKQAASTCGKDGTCDGARGCRLYPSGTECAPASCMNHTRTNPKTCDGSGACQSNGTTDCDAYLCDSTTNGCFGSCQDDNQCNAPNTCKANACGP
jgi:hypothetical protein